jgi:hypothetical protein
MRPGWHPFREETAIPASGIASVRHDRLTLGVGADEVKKFERGARAARHGAGKLRRGSR